MNPFYLLLTGMCLLTIVVVLIQPNRLVEFPYFIGLTFATFILPQLYGLLMSRIWSDEMLWDVSLMSFLCLAAAWLGYYTSTGETVARAFNCGTLHPKKLLLAGWVLVLIGVVAYIAIGGQPEEDRLRAQWTGTITKLNLFAGLVFPGFVICLYVWLKHHLKSGLIGGIIGLTFPIYLIIFLGRRQPAGHVIFAVLMLWLVVLKRSIPRWLVAVAIAFGLVVLPNIAEYRSKVSQSDPITAARTFDLAGAWEQRKDGQTGPELANAMHLIASTQARGDYGLGRAYWNTLVFNYVPAQYFGSHFKESLMIGGHEASTTEAALWNEMGYQMSFGSTVTGVGDTFRQFWYFGCLVFYCLGVGFRGLYKAARREENPCALMYYIPFSIAAINGVTHQTMNLPGVLVFCIVVLGGTLYFSKTPKRPPARGVAVIRNV